MPAPIKDNNEIEFFDLKDPKTGEVYKIPKEMEATIGHLIAFNRKQGQTEVEERYKPLVSEAQGVKAENEKIKKALDEIERANLSEKDKTSLDFQRKLQDYESQIVKHKEKADLWEQRYKQKQIMADITNAFSGLDLYNLQQTVMVLMSSGKAELIEHEGEFMTQLTMMLPDEGGKIQNMKLSPADAVKRWLALEKNQYHLKNTLQPGGGTRETNGKNKPATTQAGKFDEALQKKNFAQALELAGKVGGK